MSLAENLKVPLRTSLFPAEKTAAFFKHQLENSFSFINSISASRLFERHLFL